MRYLAGDLRAFVAAIRKELRQTRRYPTFIFGLLFWPLLLPSFYVLMGTAYSGDRPDALAAFAERSGIASVTGFVFVGFSMYMWLSMLLWGPGTALRQEQIRGSLETVYLTPASRLVILFGPPLAQLYALGIMFVILGLTLRFAFGIELSPEAIARAAVVIAIAIPAMYAIAAMFAATVLRWGEVGPAVQFVRGIFVLAAGLTYPVVMLPGWAQAVASVLPPTYIVGDMRSVLLADARLTSIAGHLAAVLGLTAVIGAAAVALYQWIEAQARRTGTLGQH